MLGVPYFLAFAVLVTAIAAWFDWRTGEIPDWVSLGPLVVAPIAHFAVYVATGHSQQAIQAAGFSVLGAALCALVPMALFRAGAIGGGDVKLLAALGAIGRPANGIWPMAGMEAQFYAILVAALIIAPARLAYEGKLLSVLGNTLSLALNPFRPKDKRKELTPEMMTQMRFGPAIFAGTCAAAVLNWRPS
jgi:prepilin peptidase CpaA